MDEIKRRVKICLKDLTNPHIHQDDRKVLIAELSAYISQMQSRHTRALVFWTKVLVGVTFLYAAITLTDLYFKYFK
jgi:hypothetical protein